MTWLWIPHASSWSSTYECVGLLRTFHPLLTSRFTFQHLPAFVFCLFCVVVWFCCFGVFLFPVFALLCFWFLFCKCLGIPNSPRSLDLDDRQGLIARSAMQQKKKLRCCHVCLKGGVLFRLGNTSPLDFFPKVTREVRSLLLSDLGNSFPLQTVFVSLFCLFLFLCCLKKKPTSAKRLGRRIWGFGV